MGAIMAFKRCAACRKKFEVRPQIREHSYCSSSLCQRERRRKWQQAKRRNDPEYKDNQSRAQQAWNERNPDYWNKYRRANPGYREGNRKRQRERNAKRKESLIAKMDVSVADSRLPSGIYRMTPINVPEIAKMDAWTVEIKLLSDTYDLLDPIRCDCKERT
jgi:hypothetical protein